MQEFLKNRKTNTALHLMEQKHIANWVKIKIFHTENHVKILFRC